MFLVGWMDLLNYFNTLHPWEAYTCVLVKALDCSSSSPNRRNIQKNYGWSLLPPPVFWNCWRQQCFSFHFGTNRTVLFRLIPHKSWYNTWNIYIPINGFVNKKREKDEYVCNLRVLEAVMTFVAAEKFVSETNVTTHAAYNLTIHHIWREWEKLRNKGRVRKREKLNEKWVESVW